MTTALRPRRLGLAEATFRSTILAGGLVANVSVSPVIYLSIVMALFGSTMEAAGVDYARYVTPTAVLWGLLLLGMGRAVAASEAVESGLVERLTVMGRSPAQIAGGMAAADLVVALVPSAATTAIAHIYGFRFDSVPAALGFAVLASVAAFFLSFFFARLGLFVGRAAPAQAVALLPYALLLFFSSGFAPKELLPSSVADVLDALPGSRLAAGLRDVAAGSVSTSTMLAAAASMAGLGAVGLLLPVSSSSKPPPRRSSAQEPGPDTTSRSSVLPPLLHRGVLLQLREPRTAVFTLALPLVLFAFITFSFGSVVAGSPSDYRSFALPAIVLMSIVFGAVITAGEMFADRQSLVLERLGTMPISNRDPLVARVSADAMRAVVLTALLVVVASVLGFRFEQGAAAAAGFLLVPIPIAVGLSLAAVFFGLRANAPSAIAPSMFPWLLPLLFISNGLVVSEALPTGLEQFARYNPMSAAIELMRGLSSAGPVASPALTLAIWTATLLPLLGLVAYRTLDRRRLA